MDGSPGFAGRLAVVTGGTAHPVRLEISDDAVAEEESYEQDRRPFTRHL
jgi:hypothetical protein